MIAHRPPSARHRRAPAGFTLIELLVTVGILAVLLAMAAPAYNSTVRNTRLSQYASDLAASTLLGRAEAIKRNAPVSLCVSANGTDCGSGGWEQGWLLMCNTSDQVACNAAGTDILVIDYRTAAPAGWKISEANALSKITFDPTGTGATAASLTVCQAAPSTATDQRVVRINATGRPVVSKTTGTSCT